MRVFRTTKIPQEYMNSTIAIGNFDGVHQGHQAVINTAKKNSKTKNTKFGVLTFEPHPKCYFNKQYDYFRLTPFREKFEIFKLAKIDFLINIKFDHTFLNKTAISFIEIDLIKNLRVNTVVTGFDFVFGNKKMGNVKYINDYVNKTKAFNFIVVPEVRNSDNVEISSSNIRALLKKGDLDQANDLLTRKWSITGNIQKGEKKARQIGFRTANIKTNKFCQIRRGVYSVILKIPKVFGQKKLFGIANFGIKPTFNKTNPLLEVHIFNFENDIYHERIKVTFYKFIREEKKFESVEKLKDQIIKDINQVKNDKLFKNNQSS